MQDQTQYKQEARRRVLHTYIYHIQHDIEQGVRVQTSYFTRIV